MAIKNVLIVDDSKTSRTQLSKLLNGYDLQIMTAESAEEAIDYLQQRQPDAIFLDHTMPGMDGLQALKIIKDNPGTATIPIAMYTSKDDKGYAEQVMAQGAVDILYKPPTPNTVSDVFGKLDKALLSSSANVARMPAAEHLAPLTPTPVQPKPEAAEPVVKALEEVVSSTVRVQLNNMLKSRLTPMVEEKIEQIGKQLNANNENLATHVVTRAVSAETASLRSDVERMVQSQVASVNAQIQAQIAELKSSTRENMMRFSDESAQSVEQEITAKISALLGQQQASARRGLLFIAGSALLVALAALGLHFYPYL